MQDAFIMMLTKSVSEDFFLQTLTVTSYVNFAKLMSKIEVDFETIKKIFFFYFIELFNYLNVNNNILANKSEVLTPIKQKVVIF